MASSDAVEYCPVSINHTPWDTGRNIILGERSVFLPEMDAEQPFDATAQHYLAYRGEQLAGYLCVDSDGYICLAAAIPTHTPDVAGALLRHAVLDTPRRGLSRLSVPKAHPWQESLLQLQFTPDANNHDLLSLFLPPDRSHNASGSELVRLEKLDDFRAFAIALARQAQRSIVIFSEDLESWLYDNDDFTSALMELAQKSRNSSVRILIRDSRHLLLHGHRLLRASHRASDKIQLHKLPSIQSEKYPCYLIADDNGLLFRQDPEFMQGIGYTDYRARAKPLLEHFEQLWARSGTDPDLRQHTV